MKFKLFLCGVVALAIVSCAKEKNPPVENVGKIEKSKPIIVKEFGFPVDDYVVVKDTVRNGDSFGEILVKNNVSYAQIQQITAVANPVFDTRRIRVGKPYTLFKSKDSTAAAQAIVYEQSKEDYIVLDWQKDTITAAQKNKPITIAEREVSGVINSNLSSTFDDLGVNVVVAYKMADIYAWTIDFFKLQKGDRFKVIYEERFVNDTVSTGIGAIKACVFEHRGREVEAFRFENDSLKGKVDYFDAQGNNLRRAFLKAPVQFSRISSRYNLKRRIAHYGYRVKPHRGTDFAAANGTPIMATADGTITKSSYTRGNGKYVKIRHNSTYETQYLHMSRRKAKVGQFVKQGDVIGYVGSTGSSSGNHVCYRFWKNGKEVDPFKQKLPASKPLKKRLMPIFTAEIEPLKNQLSKIDYPLGNNSEAVL